jgi:hypothetical protein
VTVTLFASPREVDKHLLLLGELLGAQQSGRVPPYSHLARATGLTVREVRETVERLITLGVVRVEEHAEGRHKAEHHRAIVEVSACWYCGRKDGERYALACRSHRIAHVACQREAKRRLAAGGAMPLEWRGRGATCVRSVPSFRTRSDSSCPDPRARPTPPRREPGNDPPSHAGRPRRRR